MPTTVTRPTGAVKPLLGQTTVPTAPKLTGLYDPKTKQFDLNAILQQLQQSQQEANTANVQRYNDLLQSISDLSGQVIGAGGTYSQAMDQMNQVGQAAKTRIGQAVQQQSAANQQSLISKGLGNTTIGVNLEQQAQQQGEQSLQSSEEALAGQKAGILQNQAGAQLQLGGMQQQGIQSLNQQAPNMALYTEMIKQATQGQQAAADAAKQQAAIQQQGWTDYEKRMQTQGTMMGGSSSGGASSMGDGLSFQGGGGGGGTYAPTGSSGSGGSYYGPTGNGMTVGPDLSQPGTVIGGAGQPSMMGGMAEQYPNLVEGATRPAGAQGESSQTPPVPAGEGASADQILGMSDADIAAWAGTGESAAPAAAKKKGDTPKGMYHGQYYYGTLQQAMAGNYGGM
jgi:hypothetical protein